MPPLATLKSRFSILRGWCAGAPRCGPHLASNWYLPGPHLPQLGLHLVPTARSLEWAQREMSHLWSSWPSCTDRAFLFLFGSLFDVSWFLSQVAPSLYLRKSSAGSQPPSCSAIGR